MNEITTIKLSLKTKDSLNKTKIYRRETYEDIIIRLLNIHNNREQIEEVK